MAYTNNGIYYADTSTEVSMFDIFKAFSESVDDKIDILQSKSSKAIATVTNTSTTVYSDSTISLTITPKLQSSKIVLIVMMPFRLQDYGSGVTDTKSFNANFSLKKNGSQVSLISPSIGDIGGGTTAYFYGAVKTSYTDSHNTLSPITYTIDGKCNWLTDVLIMNYAQEVFTPGTMMALEVK